MIHKPKKKRKQFDFLIDSKGVLFISTLIGVCFVLSFYIGYQFGKSQRMPEEFKQVVKQVKPADSSKVNKKDFTIFDLKKKPAKPNLTQKIKDLSDRLEQNQKKSDIVQRNSQPSTSTPPQDSKTDKTLSPSEVDEKSYTVQIAAISDYSRADTYVKQLRNKNFDAYIQSISDRDDKLIYRVRVGKISYNEAKKIIEKLKPVLDGIVPTILEIK